MNLSSLKKLLAKLKDHQCLRKVSIRKVKEVRLLHRCWEVFLKIESLIIILCLYSTLASESWYRELSYEIFLWNILFQTQQTTTNVMKFLYLQQKWDGHRLRVRPLTMPRRIINAVWAIESRSNCKHIS